MKTCKLKLYNEGSMTVQLSQHVHFLHLSEDVKGVMKCEDKSPDLRHISKGNHVRMINNDKLMLQYNLYSTAVLHAL